MQMNNIMAVHDNAEGIIGKFFYYSTSNLLVPKDKFIEIGQAFGLPKVKPAKESKAGAYRNATTAIKDRVTVKGVTGTQVYRIYCRDNKKEDAKYITRELVKETLNSRTNEYRKLANICFDKENEVIFVENEVADPDVDVHAYCQQAQEMYVRFCTCYTADQVDAVEVVHGRWVAVPSSDMMTGKAYKCSECSKMRYGSFMPNYCQNCGAKMDGGNEDGLHCT